MFDPRITENCGCITDEYLIIYLADLQADKLMIGG